jgi:hypothetical protein
LEEVGSLRRNEKRRGICMTRDATRRVRFRP